MKARRRLWIGSVRFNVQRFATARRGAPPFCSRLSIGVSRGDISTLGILLYNLNVRSSMGVPPRHHDLDSSELLVAARDTGLYRVIIAAVCEDTEFQCVATVGLYLFVESWSGVQETVRRARPSL